MNDETLRKLILEAEKDSLDRGNTLTYNIKGSSMLPILAAGDWAQIINCPWQDLRPGDIVVFHSGTLTVHRLIRKKTESGRRLIVTKGDSQWRLDPPCEESKVFGRVTLIKKDQWLLDMTSRSGRALNLCLLVLSLSRLLPAVLTPFLVTRAFIARLLTKLKK